MLPSTSLMALLTCRRPSGAAEVGSPHGSRARMPGGGALCAFFGVRHVPHRLLPDHLRVGHLPGRLPPAHLPGAGRSLFATHLVTAPLDYFSPLPNCSWGCDMQDPIIGEAQIVVHQVLKWVALSLKRKHEQFAQLRSNERLPSLFVRVSAADVASSQGLRNLSCLSVTRPN